MNLIPDGTTELVNEAQILAAASVLEKVIEQKTQAYQLPYAIVSTVRDGLEGAQLLCHFLAARSGWWTDRATGQRVALDTPRLVVEKLCLIHSEVSEAMEGDRKNLQDDKLPHRKMLEVELADVLIRVFDLAGFLNLDLAGAVIEKLAFNQDRADHKPENRAAAGGKAY